MLSFLPSLLAGVDTGIGNPPPAGTSLEESGIKNPALSKELQNLSGIDFFGKLIPNLVGLGLAAGIIVFLFVMIIGAIRWIASGGDKAQIEDARARITNGLIGVVLLLSVFAIIKILEAFFNINILTLDIGPLKIQ